MKTIFTNSELIFTKEANFLIEFEIQNFVYAAVCLIWLREVEKVPFSLSNSKVLTKKVSIQIPLLTKFILGAIVCLRRDKQSKG